MKYTLLLFDNEALRKEQQDVVQNPIWKEYQSIQLKNKINDDPALIEEFQEKVDEKFYLYNCYVIGKLRFSNIRW
jgi:hypothetical protein